MVVKGVGQILSFASVGKARTWRDSRGHRKYPSFSARQASSTREDQL